MREWDEYSVYVLEALKRIEKKLESQEALFREHMDEESGRIGAVEHSLVGVKKDLKWHSRIAGSVGSVCAIVLSWILNSK